MRTIHRDIVGTFIFSNDGYILLGKNEKGGVYEDCWLIPGGGIEEGETKLEAAVRETLEEVGIDISNFEVKLQDKVFTGASKKLLKEIDELVMVKMTFYTFTAHADKPASEIIFKCDDDMSEASWHEINSLSELNLSPPTRTNLQYMGYL